jgi:hypothetical protein
MDFLKGYNIFLHRYPLNVLLITLLHKGDCAVRRVKQADVEKIEKRLCFPFYFFFARSSISSFFASMWSAFGSKSTQSYELRSLL